MPLALAVVVGEAEAAGLLVAVVVVTAAVVVLVVVFKVVAEAEPVAGVH